MDAKPVKIADVWEVTLPPKLWRSLVSCSRFRKSSYSWVTRYCVFRLAESQNLRWSKSLAKIYNDVRTEVAQGGKLHRHMLCLYGEDIKLIQFAAMQLGISVTAFVRLALAMYLARLAMETHSSKAVTPAEFFQLGIKRWLQIPWRALNIARIPHIRQLLFNGFPPHLWWGAPGAASAVPAI